MLSFFLGIINDSDMFGYDVTMLGDLNNDGRSELAIGSIYFDGIDGSTSAVGGVFIAYLTSAALVASHQLITLNTADFTAELAVNDGFGRSVADLGDVNGKPSALFTKTTLFFLSSR